MLAAILGKADLGVAGGTASGAAANAQRPAEHAPCETRVALLQALVDAKTDIGQARRQCCAVCYGAAGVGVKRHTA
jgi:hypothetical protein